MPWKPDYITGAVLGDYIRGSVNASAAHLATSAAAASRAVDRATGRQFGSTDTVEDRLYRARWSASKGMWYVETDDFMETDDLVVAFDSAGDGTFARSIDVDGLLKYPYNASTEGKPWTGFYLRPSVSAGVDRRPAGFQASNVWGWSLVPVPDTIVEATKLQGSRFAARRSAPFGVAGSPDNGSETRLLARADPDVKVSVADYARRAWAR